jgi:hypothetical protein
MKPGGSWFQASLGKNVCEINPISMEKTMGVVACACNPATAGSLK